jgi:hypothetical protein
MLGLTDARDAVRKLEMDLKEIEEEHMHLTRELVFCGLSVPGSQIRDLDETPDYLRQDEDDEEDEDLKLRRRYISSQNPSKQSYFHSANRNGPMIGAQGELQEGPNEKQVNQAIWSDKPTSASSQPHSNSKKIHENNQNGIVSELQNPKVPNMHKDKRSARRDEDKMNTKRNIGARVTFDNALSMHDNPDVVDQNQTTSGNVSRTGLESLYEYEPSSHAAGFDHTAANRDADVHGRLTTTGTAQKEQVKDNHTKTSNSDRPESAVAQKESNKSHHEMQQSSTRRADTSNLTHLANNHSISSSKFSLDELLERVNRASEQSAAFRSRYAARENTTSTLGSSLGAGRQPASEHTQKSSTFIQTHDRVPSENGHRQATAARSARATATHTFMVDASRGTDQGGGPEQHRGNVDVRGGPDYAGTWEKRGGPEYAERRGAVERGGGSETTVVPQKGREATERTYSVHSDSAFRGKHDSGMGIQNPGNRDDRQTDNGPSMSGRKSRPGMNVGSTGISGTERHYLGADSHSKHAYMQRPSHDSHLEQPPSPTHTYAETQYYLQEHSKLHPPKNSLAQHQHSHDNGSHNGSKKIHNPRQNATTGDQQGAKSTSLSGFLKQLFSGCSSARSTRPHSRVGANNERSNSRDWSNGDDCAYHGTLSNHSTTKGTSIDQGVPQDLNHSSGRKRLDNQGYSSNNQGGLSNANYPSGRSHPGNQGTSNSDFPNTTHVTNGHVESTNGDDADTHVQNNQTAAKITASDTHSIHTQNQKMPYDANTKNQTMPDDSYYYDVDVSAHHNSAQTHAGNYGRNYMPGFSSMACCMSRKTGPGQTPEHRGPEGKSGYRPNTDDDDGYMYNGAEHAHNHVHTTQNLASSSSSSSGLPHAYSQPHQGQLDHSSANSDGMSSSSTAHKEIPSLRHSTGVSRHFTDDPRHVNGRKATNVFCVRIPLPQGHQVIERECEELLHGVVKRTALTSARVVGSQVCMYTCVYVCIHVCGM